MPDVALGDAHIHCDAQGAGTPVLLVPGLAGVGGYWAPNIPAFARRHRRRGEEARRPRAAHRFGDGRCAVPAPSM
ncbi:MAG: hypothetical protein WBW74_02320 [Xanthobacteraceae bacterium]